MLDPNATHHPPAVGPDWSAEDRLGYVLWLARITLDRIDRDNPAVPLLCKRPVRSLFQVIEAVTSFNMQTLQVARATLMRPYTPAHDYHGVAVPSEWLELLAELDNTRGPTHGP